MSETSSYKNLFFSGDRDGGSPGPDLDEEMEKVFAMSEGERFDLARFSTSPESSGHQPPEQRRYNETDYSFHRKKSYPHMHMPIKTMHPRSSMRKRSTISTKESNDGTEGTDSRKNSQVGTDSDTTISPPLNSTVLPSGVILSSPDLEEEDDTESRADDTLLSSESEALVSERAAARDGSVFSSSPDRRVQFDIGTPPIIISLPERVGDIGQSSEAAGDGEAEGEASETIKELSDDKKLDDEDSRSEKKHRRKHRHSHKGRKHSCADDSVWKKRSGAEFLTLDDRKHSIKPEEVSMLQEVDKDDLTSHRFDEPRGKRRYSAKSKAPSISSRRDTGTAASLYPGLPIFGYKKTFDHSPHEVFVQLDELHGIGDEREWKETARWIKYEEDLEEGADRWGRPHVASLSFHSLLNLRRCLETGVILLDLEEKDLPGVAYRVVEQMVIDELISAENKSTVMRALLLRHRHVHEHDRFRFSVRKNTSSYTSLQSLDEDDDSSEDNTDPNHNLSEDHKGKVKIVPSASSLEVPSSKLVDNHTTNHLGSSENKLNSAFNNNHTAVDMKEETYMSSSEDLTRKAAKESILKRIPVGAEATTVLVGAVEFLEQPTIAFIRLAEGILIPSITEVTIPVRFLFILLGPSDADLDYHEIGRSISTLMSNSEFHKVAYRANDRKELLSAINEFLDYSIVLPPGDWENQALLQFSELKEKNEAIKRRQSRGRSIAAGIEKKALLPDGGKKPIDNPLRRTRRPFGGLLNDIKRRFPHYYTDIIDGLNCQCLAAAIFMYFAALSGAITFGGLMADKTHNLIGISETLVATSGAGVVFGLLAGQPLVIVGTTGPLLLFDESLFQFCQENGIEYLTMRVYIGIWLGVIALLISFFEGSVFIKMFTRFSEDIFASLISLLYIVESVLKLYDLFKKHPLLSLKEYCSKNNETNFWPSVYVNNKIELNGITPIGNASKIDSLESGTLSIGNIGSFYNSSSLDFQNESFPAFNANSTLTSPFHYPEDVRNQPNTALFCTILALGTFFIAYYLRHFRNSKFLGRSARRALGDFGVPIAIVIMVGLDYIVPGTYTEKLKVPEGLSPSDSTVRGWVISPWGLFQPIQPWVMFAAVVPALLIYILLFMETHICELIIDKKERKLKKGSGFHLDIVLICITNIGCGLLGAPFMCAATVRSVTHVSAVTVMSRTHAPGEKPHIIDVKEQRVSALLVSILVGVSVLMAPLLRLVPMAVLFGVFLYMGISSIDGIQFFERLRLFFVPVKHHTQATYVRRVQTYKMHLFTIIQLLCLVLLWIIKSTPASLAFPFVLILMVPLRAQLRCMFTPAELRALDSDEPDIDDREDEPDFYAESLLPG
ncbi:anion exchange protein Ae2 isoform X2 [Lycorma delicatula]|uniref:anion exchange protein Ae2 isoform X2 n=1 Tax=Lycorma delicatula TaxID=130591 RepID=UPI003F511E93